MRFSFLEVFIIETLSKYALSINKFFVSSVTSVSKPPITPARATGLSSSVIINDEESSFLCWLSSVKICSPSFANRTDTVPNNLSLSKACRGWPISCKT